MPIVALNCVAVVMFMRMNVARFVLMFVNVSNSQTLLTLTTWGMVGVVTLFEIDPQTLFALTTWGMVRLDVMCMIMVTFAFVNVVDTFARCERGR